MVGGYYQTAPPEALEGEVDHSKLVCPASASHLQLLRNAEAALKKAGYVVVFSGKHENHDTPAITAQKGAQWIMVQTSQWNEFPDLRADRRAGEGHGASSWTRRYPAGCGQRHAGRSCP